MKTLSTEQIALLRAKLPDEAVTQHPTKTFLSSIKAIYVVERLNEVFGIGKWYANNEVVVTNGKMVVVKATFQAPEYGILIPDIFGGNDNPDLGDAYKGACTDALTKIGSYLEIGMDVFKGKHGKSPNGNEPKAPTPKVPEVKPKEELKPSTPNWAKAITYLQGQDASIETIKHKYALTEANEKLLKAQAADQF